MCKDFLSVGVFRFASTIFDFWMALIWFGVSVSGVAGWTMVSAFSGQKIPPTDTQTVNDEINQTKISKCRQVSIDR